MNKRIGCGSLLLFLSLSGAAHSALHSRLGGLAYYDDVLSITWVADPKLAASNTFGLAQSTQQYDPAPNIVGVTGRMPFATANLWIDGMNAANYLGVSDWRLPTASPVDGSGTFNTTFSNNGSTDWASGATGVGWQDPSGAIVSELGYMFYGNLGNLGQCTPDAGNPSNCTPPQPGSGLVNTGLFPNIGEHPQSAYWTNVPFAPDPATYSWAFNFDTGIQSIFVIPNQIFAWAVRPGDIAAVPIPGAFWLMGSGLLGVLGLRFRPHRNPVAACVRALEATPPGHDFSTRCRQEQAISNKNRPLTIRIHAET